MKKNRTFFFLIVSCIFLIILGSNTIDLYTNWLFFNELNYSSVFTKIISTQVVTGLAFGLLSVVFLLSNVIIANKINFPPIELFFVEQTTVSLNVGLLNKWVKPLTIISGIIVCFLGGIWGSSLWEKVLLFQNYTAVNIHDPIFSKDMGFYLFKFPLLVSIKSFISFIIIATIIIVSINYFLRGGISSRERNIFIDKRVKKHIGILAGLFILTTAIGFYLDRFNLLLSPHGVIFGVGYSDVNAKLPALWVLIILTLLSSIIFTVGVIRGSWKMALSPLGFTLLVYVVGFLVYPGLLQNLKVAPNELALEKTYIDHHIKFTRFGYDLERISVKPFDVSYNLTAKDIERNNATIKNIRLWDDAPLLRTYSQLQQIRTYYKFKDVDNDRYIINGEYMQVMLSPRELSYEDLPSRTWINEKLIFTHGFGNTLGPVSRISREGLPEFITKDIPPVSSADIKITRPEIYFGELSSNYVIVNTKVPEFNYPTSEGNIYTSYEGSGGVELSSFFKKAAFAVNFRTAKLILSSDITSKSKILYNRDILTRVRNIAPFLLYDTDPYIVISEDGRLFWIVDAYTVSNLVPYSQPLNKNINYMRNSVKVVVDAYNGSVSFYISDPGDVVIKVYNTALPGLFRPLSEMRDDLRKHIRYPRGFLTVQAKMFSTYHMTDPKVFYNKEDLWEIPAYGDTPIEPYYIIMKLMEEEKEEYILLLPYTPAKRDNLAAWLAARCDEPNYGKLIVYTFPRDRLVFGPKQINARIDQDSYISQQLTLWGQRGSQVIRGSLLVIPIESSLLYVQPLYLAAEDKGGLPELRRVVLAYENNVVMEENLELGLLRLFGGKRILPSREEVIEDVRRSINELAKEALQTFESANKLLRQGDWSGYGELMNKLGQILEKMSK